MTAAPATFPRHDAAAARLSLTPMTVAVQQQGGGGISGGGSYGSYGLGPAPPGWRREAERTTPGDLHPEVREQPPVSIGTKRLHPEEEAAAAAAEGGVNAESGAVTEGVSAEEGILPAAATGEPHVDDVGTEQGRSPKRPRQGPSGTTNMGPATLGSEGCQGVVADVQMAEGGTAASLPHMTTQAASAAGNASGRGETAPGADRQPLPAPNGEPGSSHVVELYLARLVLYELVDLAQYPHEV